MRSNGELRVRGIIISIGHRWSECHELTSSEAVVSQMPSANLGLDTEVDLNSCLSEGLTMGTSINLKLSSDQLCSKEARAWLYAFCSVLSSLVTTYKHMQGPSPGTWKTWVVSSLESK